MMSILSMANPAKLRARIISLGREYPVDQLINHVYLPVRQRLVLDHNTSRIMSSMFDGALKMCIRDSSGTERQSGRKTESGLR